MQRSIIPRNPNHHEVLTADKSIITNPLSIYSLDSFNRFCCTRCNLRDNISGLVHLDLRSKLTIWINLMTYKSKDPNSCQSLQRIYFAYFSSFCWRVSKLLSIKKLMLSELASSNANDVIAAMHFIHNMKTHSTQLTSVTQQNDKDQIKLQLSSN